MKYRANASEPWEELYIKALDSMEIGSVIDFAGKEEKIPAGWLICDGSAISRTEYSELFDAIGTNWGAGDGSTTFNLPPAGIVRVGYDANDTDFDTIGKTGGSKYLQDHKHTLSKGGQGFIAPQGGYAGVTGDWGAWDTSGVKTTGTGAVQVGNSGNLQPYGTFYTLIKAKNTTPTMASIVNATNNSTTDGYSCDFINKLQPVVLYDNTTGTTGNVSLSDNSNNYKYLEIYWESTYNGSRKGVAIAPTNTAYWTLYSCDLSVDFSTFYQNGTLYQISGTTITLRGSRNYNNTNQNVFTIKKVIGYK